MAKTYGRTKQEVKAGSIASQLVKALAAIEDFDGDPDMILDNARVIANSGKQGVREAITALCHYYNDDVPVTCSTAEEV